MSKQWVIRRNAWTQKLNHARQWIAAQTQRGAAKTAPNQELQNSQNPDKKEREIRTNVAKEYGSFQSHRQRQRERGQNGVEHAK